MINNVVNDWMAVITIITMLSTWMNWIVIRPIKEMIVSQGQRLQKIDSNLDMFKNDIHYLRERVVILEHEVQTLKEGLEKVEAHD